jgi:hypothetical protein
MRHEDGGQATLTLYAQKLDLHFLAQAPIERRQRLVEEQHARLDDDGAGQCYALLLAAGQLLRRAVAEAGKTNHFESTVDFLAGGGALDAPALETEGDVLRDRHVREQCVRLEHHADVAAPDRDVGDIIVADRDDALVGLDKARDDAQQRGLAGAGWAEKAGERAFREFGGDIGQDRCGAVGLGDGIDFNVCHLCLRAWRSAQKSG